VPPPTHASSCLTSTAKPKTSSSQLGHKATPARPTSPSTSPATTGAHGARSPACISKRRLREAFCYNRSCTSCPLKSGSFPQVRFWRQGMLSRAISRAQILIFMLVLMLGKFSIPLLIRLQYLSNSLPHLHTHNQVADLLLQQIMDLRLQRCPRRWTQHRQRRAPHLGALHQHLRWPSRSLLLRPT